MAGNRRYFGGLGVLVSTRILRPITLATIQKRSPPGSSPNQSLKIWNGFSERLGYFHQLPQYVVTDDVSPAVEIHSETMLEAKLQSATEWVGVVMSLTVKWVATSIIRHGNGFSQESINGCNHLGVDWVVGWLFDQFTSHHQSLAGLCGSWPSQSRDRK
jgi:hypothetical protein